MSQASRRDQAPPADRRYYWAAGLLLILPMIAVAAVPTYAREEPRLAGWPFFFWYQMVWVFLTAGCTMSAHALVKKGRQAGERGQS